MKQDFLWNKMIFKYNFPIKRAMIEANNIKRKNR